MRPSIFALLLAVAVAPTLSETIHGLVLFTRHGDRTSKFYKGYQMTNLGATQVHSSGSFYRARYVEDGAPHKILDISSDTYKPSQLWASAPDQSVLLQTATNFLQGLYPPLGTLNRDLAVETLTNGSDTMTPLNGYQFIQIHGESEEEPDTIWIKGDDSCPAFTTASNSYRKSAEYNSTLESSGEFYSQFVEPLAEIMPAKNVTYAHAYDVFDLLNVGRIHNESVASILSTSELSQLRYYADAWEWGHNYNLTQPARSIGGMALAGGVLRQLNETVSSQGDLKLSLLAGSYDTFLAFFGLTNLTAANADFMGLPDYGSSMAFELFTEDNMTSFPRDTADLRVRFLFRNGTDASVPLTAFPLFDRAEDSLAYDDFVDVLGSRAINGVDEWCSTCQSTDGFCSQKEYSSPSGSSSSNADSESSSSSRCTGLTPVQAGVTGAMTTLGFLALVAAAVFIYQRMKSKSTSGLPSEKVASDSEAESGISA
ncbi:MAG: hypothetical protein M1837_001180 [Sclerophora amabilis]|nr:MAG: hypothetical protein M1837_001180 [Sclerophora amabilis]